MNELHSDCLTSIADLSTEQFAEVALVLGDQLNSKHSWFAEVRQHRLFVMFEMRQETDYCRHHIQKVVGFFAAMRAFASALADKGHKVLYLALDNKQNQQKLLDNLDAVIKHTQCNQVLLQQPDEYRLDHMLSQWSATSKATIDWYDSEHFLTERDSLTRWFGDKDSYLMEYFYRRVRKQTGYLMNGDQPVGEQWNFDKQNRKSLGTKDPLPEPLLFAHDVTPLVKLIEQQGIGTMGNIEPQRFIWPLHRGEALELLDYFVSHLLCHFGDYQDAMHTDSWTLFHARLSFALNTKLIAPKEVVEAAIDAWQNDPERISLNQIEGFVRQIIGWREFIRAIYWHFMPAYSSTNFFDLHQPLPSFYWNGETKMNCLQHSIQQSLDHAYAHHIQRLMVTGNFALLTGTHPDAVDSWYLGIYIDAIEWVELPNTRSMSQFADAGKLASKPYVSSGSYINKMSNYCHNCHYDVKRKFGANACPFNLLYWNFIDQHFEKLKSNQRMSLILSQWQQRKPDDKAAIIDQAQAFLESLPRS
ncbi:(6-4) photolyase [Pseudidiomarina piscicola]|uniref:(6-4) photolyase n=1 Tax=Pseudidiomarina piscicola TaxID=2614830 RepID=A0A776EPU8_9GAMM|nr:cryptochrome/photolyase family protein [Pseudidiomarina piscicola]CAB0151917.1 (6-4) photolyase [Pseudidiomarina piscicola]VZT41358.1 (6-4) photolyase [Pseudomonas aeruginosa]